MKAKHKDLMNKHGREVVKQILKNQNSEGRFTIKLGNETYQVKELG